MRWLGWVLVFALVGCGDDGPMLMDDGGGGPGAPDGGGGGGPDAGVTATRLITATYTIPVGDELYWCERITTTEDLYITRITPVDGSGTHHQVFALDPTPEADGASNCGPIDTDWITLFASGINSPSLALPPGVALHVPAGEQVVLDLHLFNATDYDIEDSASLDVVLVDAAEVQAEAEVVLAGPIEFSIPAGATGYTVSGGCTMSGPTSFFAVFPHMHQLGRHITVTAMTDGAPTVVYDDDYQFSDQDFATFPPLPLGSGDRILVDCRYDNPTGQTVGFGDSSTDEMCFAISYRYPRLGTSFGGICPF